MRRIFAASIIAVVLGCFAAACAGLASPSKTILCPGILYCGSAVVPQSVSGGTCCTVVDFSTGRLLTTAATGYLCAYGANRQPAGCAATLEQARVLCPDAPSIVRCVAE